MCNTYIDTCRHRINKQAANKVTRCFTVKTFASQTTAFSVGHSFHHTPFLSSTLPIMHPSCHAPSRHAPFPSCTLPVMHLSIHASFPSYTLPITHPSHHAPFPSRTLPVTHPSCHAPSHHAPFPSLTFPSHTFLSCN